MGSFKIVQEEKSRLSTFLICGKLLLLKYLTYHFWFTYSLHGCHRSVSNRDEGQRKGQKEKAVTFDDNYLKSNYLTYSLVGIRTQDPQLRRLLLYPTELPDRPFCVLLCLPWESKAADAKIRVILGKTQNFLAEQSSSHSAAQHCLFTASPADGRTGPHGGRRRGHD